MIRLILSIWPNIKIFSEKTNKWGWELPHYHQSVPGVFWAILHIILFFKLFYFFFFNREIYIFITYLYAYYIAWAVYLYLFDFWLLSFIKGFVFYIEKRFYLTLFFKYFFKKILFCLYSIRYFKKNKLDFIEILIYSAIIIFTKIFSYMYKFFNYFFFKLYLEHLIKLFCIVFFIINYYLIVIIFLYYLILFYLFIINYFYKNLKYLNINNLIKYKQESIKQINVYNIIMYYWDKNIKFNNKLQIYLIKSTNRVVLKHIHITTPQISKSYRQKLDKTLYNYVGHYIENKTKLTKILDSYNKCTNTLIKLFLKTNWHDTEFIKMQIKNIFTDNYIFFKINSIVVDYYYFYKPLRLNIVIYFISCCFHFLEKIICLIPYVIVYFMFYVFYNILILIFIIIIIYIKLFFKNITKFIKLINQFYWLLFSINLQIYIYILPVTYYFFCKNVLYIYIYILKKLPVFKYLYTYSYKIHNYTLLINNFFKIPTTTIIVAFFYKIYNITHKCTHLILQYIIYFFINYFFKIYQIFFFYKKNNTYTHILIKYMYFKRCIFSKSGFFFFSCCLISHNFNIYFKKQWVYQIWCFCVFNCFKNMIFFFNFLKKFDKIHFVQTTCIHLYNELIVFFKLSNKTTYIVNCCFLLHNQINLFLKYYIHRKIIFKYKTYYFLINYIYFFKYKQWLNNNILKNFKIKFLTNTINIILAFYSFVLFPVFFLLNPTNFFQYLRNTNYIVYKLTTDYIKAFLENIKLNYLIKKTQLKDWLSIPFVYLIDPVEYSIIKQKKYMYFSVLRRFYKPNDRYKYIQFDLVIKLKHLILFCYFFFINYYLFFKTWAASFIFFKITNYKVNSVKYGTIKLITTTNITKFLKKNTKYILFFINFYNILFLPINFINNFILLFSLSFKNLFIKLTIKQIWVFFIKLKYKKYKIKKKIKIEFLLFFVMTKHYYRQYFAMLIYYMIFYPIIWIHRHTIYLVFILTYFYTEDFNLEIVMFTFAEEHHNILAYMVRHKYLWPITILFINLDLLYIITPFLSTLSLLFWSKRNQWYLGKWLWTFFIFPICLEFHRPLLIKFLWLLFLEDYRILNILFFKIPYISDFIKLNNLYHIPLIMLFIWFIKLSIRGLAYRHAWKKPNLPRWHYLRFPIYICIIEAFRFKIIYFIHILMLYYYEKLNMTSQLCKLILYLEDEPEVTYYYEFFFYTFLRVHVEDVLTFLAEIKYLNSLFLGATIDFWIILIVLRCLSLYSRDFLNTDEKYGMFPQGMYMLCYKYFIYIAFFLWFYKQYLEIDIHLIIIYWIMKYSIFVFLYFQVTLYMFPRKVIPWYFSIISEFWPTLYNDIHKSMSVMIPTQDAMMVFQQIFEDIIKGWKKQRQTYMFDKNYTFFYLWQFQVRKRKKLHLFAAYNRLMTRMHFMLREHMDLFYLGWRFDFYTNWRKRYIYEWKINPWQLYKFNLLHRALILKDLCEDINNNITLYKFSIKYTYNLINYKYGVFYECLYLFNYSVFKQNIKSKRKKNYWLKTNLFVYTKRRKMLYDWKQDLFYKSRRYEELYILQDLKRQILANNLEPANEFGERPEIFWPPEYWLQYKKEGWKLFTDPEIDKFIYAPFSDYRYIPKYLYDMEVPNKQLELYMAKKKTDVTIK